MTKYELYNLRRKMFKNTVLYHFPAAEVKCYGKHVANNNCLVFNFAIKMEGSYIELQRKLRELNYQLTLFYGVREKAFNIGYYKEEWPDYIASGKNWVDFSAVAAFSATFCDK